MLKNNSKSEKGYSGSKLILFAILLLFYTDVTAQSKDENTFEVYGHIMLDAGYDIKTIDPDYFDVLRPTKLPSFSGQFAPEGKTYFSVRQTRFGVKSNTPTKLGNLKTQFEFELFGSGKDVGQTAFRLRHAYGELGKFGAGQYWSAFMDPDFSPLVLEKTGPPGMVLYRNLQVRYMPLQGDSKLTFALERPGGSADGGEYAELIELNDVTAKLSFPDFTGNYRYSGNWGYVQLGGILKSMKWVSNNPDSINIEGSVLGWGGNLSSTINISPNDNLKISGVYGEGIENYMNDSSPDIGAEAVTGNALTPFKGVSLPITGVVAFYNHKWNEHFSSTAGYSMLNIENSDAQSATAFKRGQYVIVNFLYYPAKNFMTGIEYQWGERKGKNGFISTDTKIQFSVKANFSKIFSWK